MNIIRFSFIVGLCICSAHADTKRMEDEKSVGLILESFLVSYKMREWEKVYMLYNSETQRFFLCDAFVNLNIIASGDDPEAQSAKDILERNYKKDEAEFEIKNSKMPLSRKDDLLLRTRHIIHPTQLYVEWMLLEEKINPDMHKKARESIASANLFSIKIEENTATAFNEKLPLKVLFTKEQEKWKVVGGVYIQLP